MRFEYKYVVPMERLNAVRHDLLPLMTADAFALRQENHRYTVRSIYFDTPRFSAYREKLEGVQVRKKLRVRAYNSPLHSNEVFLEIKKKIDQRGAKHRAAVRCEDLAVLFGDKAVEEQFLPGGDLARRFMFHVVRSAMKPVMLVTYEREAYVGRFDQTLRVTLDAHLRFLPFPAISELFEESRLRHLAPRFFIMEIKFNNGFSPWLQMIVKRHGLIRTSVSKYGSCVGACAEIRPMLRQRLSDNPSPETRRWKESAL